MKSMLTLLALALVLSSFYACDKDKTKPELPPTTIELSLKAKSLIVNSNGFGVELFTQTAQGSGDNMMLSPLSASVALTMLLNGSDSATFSQIRDMLGYSNELDISEINEAYKSLVSQLLTADNKVKLSIANAVFHRQDFVVKSPFTEALSKDFSAQVQSLDFASSQALNTINNWASDNTNGKIPKVIDNIRDDAVMFLMNALYFKGDWTKQFDKSKTSKSPFYLDDGTTIEVNSMNHDKLGAMFYEGQDFTALEIPYGRRNFSMIVMLPDNGLNNFYQNFTPQVWNEMTTALNSTPEWSDFVVSLPKFRFEYETILNDQLQALGMIDAFNPNLADFSGISDTPIHVDFVKQNTFVDVNEEGTEAAAVTTIGMVETSMPPMFVADKPFAFAIRERTTNTLLFIGSVTDPR
jgi:serine protease inhibitor